MRGVCWSTSQNPTINDNKTTDGSGTGSFTSQLTGLSRNTIYYVRAYATNSAGTSYGDQKSIKTPKYSVGENAEGGIIAYVDGTGEHGFVIRKSGPLSQKCYWAPWESYDVFCGATGSAIGTGKINTEKILNSYEYTNGIAAYLCDNYSENGYSDWCLPSIDELKKVYDNRSQVDPYNDWWNYYEYMWSSTEINTTYVYGLIIRHYGGEVIQLGKWGTETLYYVLPMRYF